ncbi:hypothetical protein [Kitasatospora mediocidica]|uniref:hypothetical protein n=1 Tax=Kitasatospora mediocidica TaxID=58352 RepID=UPI00055E1585|nr:hypothetical protein [Kitasatospora mediocidica]
MRLYTRTGATALDDPEWGHFEADEQGGFDLPDQLAEQQRAFAVRGSHAWETDIERQHRLVTEERERRQDPATLLQAVEQLVKAQVPSPSVENAAPVKRTSKRAPSTPAGN